MATHQKDQAPSKFTGSYPTERKDAQEKIDNPLAYARRKRRETREALSRSWLLRDARRTSQALGTHDEFDEGEGDGGKKAA